MELNFKSVFAKDGYVVVRGMFSKDEIKSMREGIERSLQENINSDLLSNPYLSHIPTDERVLKVYRYLLGTDRPCWWGEGNWRIERIALGWHKDNAQRYCPGAPDWTEPYTVIRCGIYLQDHKNNSGGLSIRAGSHKICNLDGGELRYFDSEPGDIAFWHQTITHTGGGRITKWFPKKLIDPHNYWQYPDSKFKPMPKEKRIAIFMNMGKRDACLTRHLNYLKTRTDSVKIWQNTSYDQKRIESVKDLLDVINVADEVKDWSLDNLSQRHHDLPYAKVFLNDQFKKEIAWKDYHL